MGKRKVDWDRLNQYFADHPTASARQAAERVGCSPWAANKARKGQGFVKDQVGEFNPQHMTDELVALCQKHKKFVGHILYGYKRPEQQLDLLEELDEN